MKNAFFEKSPALIFESLQRDLSHIDPKLKLGRYRDLSVNKLSEKIDQCNSRIDKMRKGKYGSWLKEESYVRETLLLEGLKLIEREKREKMQKERLVPGSYYFKDIVVENGHIDGKVAIYLGEDYTGWMPFSESMAVAKAMEVLRFGTTEDFRQIYVGLADGDPDHLSEISLRHITESSPRSLMLIEKYCDSRWVGDWPWEVEPPEKFKNLVENREEKRMKNINEMQRRFTRMLREFEQANMGQYEMITAAQDMSGQVDSMISSLGKIASSGIEVMAGAKAGGQDSDVQALQQVLGEPLNQAVTVLTDLKAKLDQATSAMAGDPAPDVDSDLPMDDDLGSPADAMGGDDPLADVEIGDESDERVKKDI